MIPSGPLSEIEKGKLRQIENRHEVYEDDVQHVAGILLKLSEYIEQKEREEWERN